MKQRIDRVSDFPLPTTEDHVNVINFAVTGMSLGDPQGMNLLVSVLDEHDAVLRALEEKGYSHLDGSAREIIAKNLLPNVDEKENYSA
jgi:hypothetical protein